MMILTSKATSEHVQQVSSRVTAEILAQISHAVATCPDDYTRGKRDFRNGVKVNAGLIPSPNDSLENVAYHQGYIAAQFADVLERLRSA